MKLGVYQGPSTKGDVELALETVDTTVSAVAAVGGKMVVFPELFLPGYNQSEKLSSMAQTQNGSWEIALSNCAEKYGCGLTIGWSELDNGSVFNSATCFDETGAVISRYRKQQLFGPMEKSIFQVGDGYQTFSFNGYQVAMLICYDVEFAHHVHALGNKGVDLLLVPTANPKIYDHVQEFIVPARAAEARMTIVYANYCGEENGLVYGGKSLIVGPDAVALAKAGQGETLLIADLSVIQGIDDALLSTQQIDRRD